jgi:hypothetical protein
MAAPASPNLSPAKNPTAWPRPRRAPRPRARRSPPSPRQAVHDLNIDAWLSRGPGNPARIDHGRPWREGPPRNRGGPGAEEAGRHASSGPEMCAWVRGHRRTTSRPGSPGDGARACELPQHRDRRRLSLGIRAFTRWPAALAVMPADRLMPLPAPPVLAGRRMQAAAPSSGPARRPRRGLRSGYPAEPGRHRVRRVR